VEEQALTEQLRRAELTLASFPKIKSTEQSDVALETLEEALTQADIPQDR